MKFNFKLWDLITAVAVIIAAVYLEYYSILTGFDDYASSYKFFGLIYRVLKEPYCIPSSNVINIVHCCCRVYSYHYSSTGAK